MAEPSDHPITTVLKRLEGTAQSDVPPAPPPAVVSSELLPLVYAELRDAARAMMARMAPGQTLQPTALVHEAYLRVAGGGTPSWQSRWHFFAAAAQAMRNVLVDEARRKNALKRGGGRRRVELEIEGAPIKAPREDLVALDEALRKLETLDPRKAQIVMLRFFAGLSVPETSDVLQISKATVDREWRFIRVWLFREMEGENGRGSGGPTRS